MVGTIMEWIKGWFVPKGATQIGSKNKSVSGVTASENANVVVGDRNIVSFGNERQAPFQHLPGEPALELSNEEKDILLKLLNLPGSTLRYTKNQLGPILDIERKELFDVFDNQARVTWLEAYEHLLKLGLLKDFHGDGQVFHLSTAGRSVAETLKDMKWSGEKGASTCQDPLWR